MKKLIPFLLSLTTILANAQYNRTNTTSSNSALTPARTASSTLTVTSDNTVQKLPYFLRQPAAGAPPSLTNLNDPLQPAVQSPLLRSSIQGSWLKPWTPPSTGNGRFQSIQSFDMQHNVSDSKATYQFTKRKQ